MEGSGLKRLIITGANGVGKSYLAAQLARVRPDVAIISYDALRLKTGWQKIPRPDIERAMSAEIEKDAWILEGGPSLLPLAIARADALIWIDPSEIVRAGRLALRPWKYLGRTRPELPDGNVDWPWQQYKFALRSLRNRAKFRSHISRVFSGAQGIEKWHCRSARDIESVIDWWSSLESSSQTVLREESRPPE